MLTENEVQDERREGYEKKQEKGPGGALSWSTSALT